MASSDKGHQRIIHPIDLVEQLAATYDWATDRMGDDELTLVVGGNWTDYHVSLNWRDDLEALHLACAFDFRVPENRLERNVPPDRADQRAALARAFRSLDPGGSRHVPPRAPAQRRA